MQLCYKLLAMLALFEVLSFKVWLDIRDVLIKTLGPVKIVYFSSMFIQRLQKFNYEIFNLDSRDIHSHFCVLGLHDRVDIVCWCRYCQLL